MTSPRNDFEHYDTLSPSVDAVVYQKKKLRLWLLERLDVNDCPGCLWMDTNRRVFRLSWKHYGRPGFDEERVFNYVINFYFLRSSLYKQRP